MILGIYGTSGVGREVLDIALLINRNDKRWTEIIFINDYRYGESVHNIEVHPFSYILGKYAPDRMEISIAMGEPELRKLVAERVEAVQSRQGFYISCIEGIAWRRGFISTEQLRRIGDNLKMTDYGQYLIALAESGK